MIVRILIAFCLVSVPVSGSATDIQPQSGTWAGQVVFDGQSGCPAQVADQMKTARQGYADQPLNFPAPFAPETLQGNDPNFIWRKISPNIWDGIYSDVQPTGLGTLTVISKSIVVVIAPDQINQVADLTVDLPQSLAQSMGMATTTCVIRSNVYHKRTGP